MIYGTWFLKQIFAGLCYQHLPTDYQFSLGPSGNDDSKIFCLDFLMTKSKVLPNTNRKFQVANMAQRRQKNRKPHIKVMLSWDQFTTSHFLALLFHLNSLKLGRYFETKGWTWSGALTEWSLVSRLSKDLNLLIFYPMGVLIQGPKIEN